MGMEGIELPAWKLISKCFIFLQKHQFCAKLRDAQYRDVLVGASCVVTSLVKTRPDFFSLSMMFSGPIALCTFILRALEINWYKFYRNNHFKRVKNSYYFIYPIVIVLLAYGINVFSYLPYRLSVWCIFVSSIWFCRHKCSVAYIFLF